MDFCCTASAIIMLVKNYYFFLYRKRKDDGSHGSSGWRAWLHLGYSFPVCSAASPACLMGSTTTEKHYLDLDLNTSLTSPTKGFIKILYSTLLEMPMALILADSLPSSFNWCLPSNNSWGISSSSAVGKHKTKLHKCIIKYSEICWVLIFKMDHSGSLKANQHWYLPMVVKSTSSRFSSMLSMLAKNLLNVEESISSSWVSLGSYAFRFFCFSFIFIFLATDSETFKFNYFLWFGLISLFVPDRKHSLF